MTVEEATQPPGQIRHKQSLIIDLEAIDNPEINPDKPGPPKAVKSSQKGWVSHPPKKRPMCCDLIQDLLTDCH
jgi:hypothetical protein